MIININVRTLFHTSSCTLGTLYPWMSKLQPDLVFKTYTQFIIPLIPFRRFYY